MKENSTYTRRSSILIDFFERVYVFGILCCAHVIAFAIYVRLMISRDRNDTLHTNIQFVYPSITVKKERQLIRKYNKVISHIAMSYFLLYLFPHRQLHRIITYKNLSLLDKLYKEKRNVVLLFPHYDNWAYTPTLPLYTSYVVMGVHGNTKKFYDKVRTKFGIIMVRDNKIYKTILKNDNNASTLYVILADQPARKPPFKEHVIFFGKKLYIQSGVEKILRHTHGVAVYLDIKKVSGFHYEYSFRLFDSGEDNYDTLLQRLYTELEQKIKGRPELWLRWGIKRWKEKIKQEELETA